MKPMARKTKPTKLQKQVHKFLLDFYNDNDRLPSSRELSRQFGWKSNTSAINHLRALSDWNLIEKTGDGHYRFARVTR